MKPLRDIRGAGGGGGKGGGGGASQRTPVEAPDSLRSRQYARVIDAVCEGEVVGLVNGLKSVYLDDTPVQNADGSYNFSGVTLATRNGTQSQSYIEGFSSVEAEVPVATPVTTAAPVVRSVSDTGVDAIRVTLSTSGLSFQDPTNGDISGTSVNLAIDLQSNGGGYVEVVNTTISGKTSSKYQRAFLVPVSGSGPWDIRVRRITADSAQSNLRNATSFDSFTKVFYSKLKYPNTALVALSVDSEKFRSIPVRGYEMLGLILQVPSNYDAATRTYTGTWDGTFQLAWSNNPAWCFYELVTNERYGLGDFIDASQVDKWALYQIAQYCDELVDDGFGGQEPRYTCNLYIQTREEAYKVIQSMAAIFAGLTFWGSGAITAIQDSPADPVASFTAANVINGAFSYSGSSVKTRHTVALVSWNDPADRYRQKIEYVADEEGIARYGVVQTEVIALGCTSRGQAHRFGRSILYTERRETETISFRAGLDGLSIYPGEVIQTSDPVRAGVRLGGRLLAATTTAFTLDAPVTIAADQTYTLWCVLPDGSVESRAVITGAGTTDALTVGTAFTTAPQTFSVWVLAASNLAPETWRVISITEVQDGDGAATQAEITALKYSAAKYAEIESGIVLEPVATSTLNAIPAVPTQFLAAESLYLAAPDVVGVRITASWLGSAPGYELQYRRENGNWAAITTSASSVDIQPVDAGNYEFSLVAVNAIGRRSPPVSYTLEVIGKSAKPANVENFNVIKSSGLAFATWDLAADLDVRVSGRVVIRHTPASTGATWEQGVVLEEFNGDAVSGTLPLMQGTYMAKFRDSTGNYSNAATLFVATEGLVTGFTTVGTITFNPTFAGTYTDVGVVDSRLQLVSQELFDSSELIDSSSDIDGGDISPTGQADFTSYLDIGTNAIRRMQATITAISFDVADFIDGDDDIDSTEDIDGSVINDCDATLYIATTPDNPAGSPTWSAWQPFFVGDFGGRAYKFRLGLSSGSPSHTIGVSALSVTAKIPA